MLLLNWVNNSKRLLRRWFRLVDPRYSLSRWILKVIPVSRCGRVGKIMELMPAESADTPEILDMRLIPAAEHVRRAVHDIPAVTACIMKDMRYIACEERERNLLLCDRRRIIFEYCNSMDSARDFPWLPVISADNGEYIEGKWTALRSVSNNHGHTLLDNIPRVTALTLAGLEPSGEINLLVAGELGSFEKFLLERLLPSGLKIRHLQPRKLYTIDEYVLISNPRQKRFGGYLSSWYREYFRQRVLPDRPGRRNRRIYISRENAGMRRVLNEDDVLALLGEYGFIKYNLEEMTPEDEVDLFYDAEAVAGPAGSGMFNVMFSQNIKLLDIYPTNFIRPETYFMCKSLGHDYTCLYSGKGGFSDDFHADLGEIRNWLEKSGL